jgi:hypothetical protein
LRYNLLTFSGRGSPILKLSIQNECVGVSVSRHAVRHQRWRPLVQWLRDDWAKTVGPVTTVRLLRKHPRLLLGWLVGLAVVYGIAGGVVMVVHKGWLLSQYGYAPGMLVSAQLGARLYGLKRCE